MNRDRRKQLRKWIKLAESLKDELESICSDEETYFDTIPENLQGGTNGTNSEEAINQMYEAIDYVNEAIGAIEDII